MSTRERMTYRATIQRNSQTAIDEYNMPATPIYETLTSDVACYYWEPANQVGEVVGAPHNYDLYQHRILLPSGTDVLEEDRITSITDRRGRSVTSHVFDVRQVVRMVDHLLLVLRAVES